MKIRKILTLFILICVSVLCFAGCANIEFIRAVDATDTIIDRLVITLDKSKIDKSGKVSFEKVRMAVYDDLCSFRNYVEEWKKSFQEDHIDVFLRLETGIVCSVIPHEANPNQLTLTMEFSNWSMFGVFYGMTEIEDVEYEKAMEDVGPFIEQIVNHEYKTENFGLFLYKYSMIKDDGIMSGLDDFKIDKIGVEYYDKYAQMTGFSKDDVNVSQVFAYPDDRLYSNADTKEVVQNMTFLAWNLSDKEDGFQMCIYKLAPRTTIWYILALIVSAIAVVIIYFVIRKKQKESIRVDITKQEVEKDE